MRIHGFMTTANKTPAKTSEKKAVPTKKDATKDPKGGLTAAGRKAFAQKEGAHLRPGVQGAADTPEKMKRKGSFLRRHFANPRGPMERDGEPTRLALSAHAWGEPIPKTEADAKELADKGSKLLEQFHAVTDGKKPAQTKSQELVKQTKVAGKVAKTPAEKAIPVKKSAAKISKKSETK